MSVGYFKVYGLHTLYLLLLYLCMLSTVSAARLQSPGEFSAVDVDTGARVYYRVDERGYALHDDIILGMHSDIMRQGGQIKSKVLPYPLDNQRTKPLLSSRRAKRAAPEIKADLFWPDNTVYYSFEEKTDRKATDTTRVVVNDAIDIFHKLTHVRFVKIGEAEKDKKGITYLNIQTIPFDGNSCGFSYVGKVFVGAQPLQIARDATCLTVANVLHELMHALGFQHEHQRPDRGQYISLPKYTINNLKITNPTIYKPSLSDEAVFDLRYPIVKSIKLNSDFDFNSIMLYGNAFVKKTRNDADNSIHEQLIGPPQQLSEKDIRAINELYPKHFIIPRQIALAKNQSQGISLFAPCDATIGFSKPNQVHVTPSSCQDGQHNFTISALETIDFTNSDVIFKVSLSSSGTYNAQEERSVLRIVPRARRLLTAEDKSTLNGSETLTITLEAACKTVVLPYEYVPSGQPRQQPLSGLVITYRGCQNSQHSFNIKAHPVASPNIRSLYFKLSYGELYEEYLPFMLTVQPATATTRQVPRDPPPDHSDRAVSDRHRWEKGRDTLALRVLQETRSFATTGRCIQGNLNLDRGKTVKLKKDLKDKAGGNLNFLSPPGHFKYCNDSPSKSSDSFTVDVISSDGKYKKEIQVELHTRRERT